MKNRWVARALIMAMVVAFVALAAISWVGRELARQGPLAEPKTVVIPLGTPVRGVARLLADEGVVACPSMFHVVARLSGFGGTFKAGEYAFDAGVSMRQVMKALAFGKTTQRGLTVPEGLTVRQVIALLEANEALAGEARPIPEEGMLFPDTYMFTNGTTRAKLIESMTVRMERELANAWETRTQPLPINSPDELLVLASMIEKEAAHDAEMPEIAGVFVNRLRRGMLLQSDPTVMYGAEITDNNIRRSHLQEDHPFNTYKHAGLPPTPIANPGLAALKAAANPTSTTALFFMAKPDRSGHVFSDTYPEHQKAVKAYWDEYRKQQKAKP